MSINYRVLAMMDSPKEGKVNLEDIIYVNTIIADSMGNALDVARTIPEIRTAKSMSITESPK